MFILARVACFASALVKKILQRDCNNCSERCPKCRSMRKDILAFDYMPLGDQIASLCKSRTFCYDFLNMWRHKEKWLNPSSQPDNIIEFWDGLKVREYAYFWDPSKDWELPVICQNSRCKQSYATFPESQRCQELVKGWNAVNGMYTFTCTSCRAQVQAARRMQKV